MKKYLLKRLVLCLIVIFGVILITFTISRVVPADAAAKWAGARATPEQVEAALRACGASFTNLLPLSLEEVFVYEPGGELHEIIAD